MHIATLLAENVIDTTPLASGLPLFQLPWCKSTYNAGFLALAESERIMGTVPWHSGVFTAGRAAQPAIAALRL